MTIADAHIRMRGVMVMINVETTVMRKTVQIIYITLHVHAVISHGIWDVRRPGVFFAW